MRMASYAAALNRVPREKLSQLLNHILEKRATESGSGRIFSAEEMQQLTAMLQLSPTEIESVVAAAITIFQEAATFGDGIRANVLHANGVNLEVVTVLEKIWRKKGQSLAAQFISANPLDPSATVKRSQWELHVELGNRYTSRQSEPVACFQLELDNEKESSLEKLDIEMNHSELLLFFKQLNTIQRQIDASNVA